MNPDNQNGNTPADHRQAEVFNYHPAKRARLNYLLQVARLESSPKDQESEALFRIAQGKGGMVSLPDIQQGPGRKFIAQLSARIHSLRNRYGFTIKNLEDRTRTPVLSVYWLEMDSTGRPVMRTVPIAESKTGRPQTVTTSTAKPQTVCNSSTHHASTRTSNTPAHGWKRQNFYFGNPKNQHIFDPDGQDTNTRKPIAPVPIAPAEQDGLFGDITKPFADRERGA